MGTEPTLKLLIAQGIPNLLAMWGVSLYFVIDSIFVGKYVGDKGLSAQSIVSILENLFCSMFASCFSLGVSALISPAAGRKDYKLANNLLMQFLYLTLFVDVLIPAVILPCLTPFLQALGAVDPDVLDMARQYSFWMILLGPLFYSPCGGFLPLFRVENKAMLAMILQIASSAITLIMDVSMFPSLGKKLKLMIALLSTLISLFIVGVITTLRFFTCVVRDTVLHFTAKVKPSWKLIVDILLQSIPQICNRLPQMLGMLVTNLMITKYAKTERETTWMTGAVGIYSRYTVIAMQPRVAFQLAFSSIGGYNLGRKDYGRVCRVLVETFWTMIIITLVFSLICVIWTRPIATIFGDDKEFTDYAGDAAAYGMIGAAFSGPHALCAVLYTLQHRPMLATTL